MFWGGFAQFRCRTSPISKTSVGVHTKHEFFPLEPFLRFSQRTCPIHYFRSKTHVWGGFAQFRCRTSPISKMGVGVHTKHEFLPPEPFFRFSQRTCPIHHFRSKTHVFSLHPSIWEIVENEMHFDSSDNLVFINEQIKKMPKLLLFC
jgi:hypothetical protein